jgi:hypothetical protein
MIGSVPSVVSAPLERVAQYARFCEDVVIGTVDY